MGVHSGPFIVSKNQERSPNNSEIFKFVLFADDTI